VSCVSHTPPCCGSRIISGGGDGKVCLWNARGVVCEDFNPKHDAPISVLKCDREAPLAVSASYDKSVRLWCLPQETATVLPPLSNSTSSSSAQSRVRSSRQQTSTSSRKRARELATLRSHGAPVLCLTWSQEGIMMSGDRDGILVWHDLRTGQKLRQSKHGQGHVTCASHTFNSGEGLGDALQSGTGSGGGGGGGGGEASLYVSGGQDGCVRLYDLRQEQCVANLKLHTSKKGTGALVEVLPGRGGVIVTAAADNRICVLDMRTVTRLVVLYSMPPFCFFFSPPPPQYFHV
jgi:WD40 repeat protein